MSSLKKLLYLSLTLLLLGGCASSGGTASDDGPKHKLVLQINTDDPRTQKIVLNNAINVQKAYGMDNVIVEVVAYGPGLGILTMKSKNKTRVSSLIAQDITFSACDNTMKKIAKKKGKKPALIDGVKVVPAGVVRIMELQEAGYSYVRP